MFPPALLPRPWRPIYLDLYAAFVGRGGCGTARMPRILHLGTRPRPRGSARVRSKSPGSRMPSNDAASEGTRKRTLLQEPGADRSDRSRQERQEERQGWEPTAQFYSRFRCLPLGSPKRPCQTTAARLWPITVSAVLAASMVACPNKTLVLSIRGFFEGKKRKRKKSLKWTGVKRRREGVQKRGGVCKEARMLKPERSYEGQYGVWSITEYGVGHRLCHPRMLTGRSCRRCHPSIPRAILSEPPH